MKPVRIVLSPTRSRPFNVFLGLVLLLASAFLLLALATYHSTDPSLNTATGETARNWTGLFGSWLSDLLLQSLGVTAFFLPLWLGGIGWTWMHSRPGGSPLLRWIGALLAMVFLPSVFALLPWHWLWMHEVPVEGVMGRLMVGLLVRYLNIQGAWLVAGVLAAAGLYFALAVSFWAIKENLEDHWFRILGWHDRWRNWREERAERREEREVEHESVDRPDPFSSFDAPPVDQRPSRLAALFRRRDRAPIADPLDDIPAFQRATPQPAEKELHGATPPRRSSIWERATASSAPPVDGPVPASSSAHPTEPSGTNHAPPLPTVPNRRSPYTAVPMQTCAPPPWPPRM